PASEISFTVDMLVPEGEATPGLRIEKSYNSADFVPHESLSNWPARPSYSLIDLVQDWPGLSLDKLRKGDEIRLRAMPVGATDFRIGEPISTTLVCPSDIAGTYLSTTVGSAGPGGGGVFDSLYYELFLAYLGNGDYEISEISGGMYPLVWNGKPQSAILKDSCLQIVIPSQSDQWGDKISGSGRILGDGRIYYQWVNTYGDKGQTWLKKN
ncbi:MAG: hypothetical protein NWR72_07215, partial [Bacteroidia bacterium]|nr:hypothetical protein [Bacteroidia bacterium]